MTFRRNSFFPRFCIFSFFRFFHFLYLTIFFYIFLHIFSFFHIFPFFLFLSFFMFLTQNILQFFAHFFQFSLFSFSASVHVSQHWHPKMRSDDLHSDRRTPKTNTHSSPLERRPSLGKRDFVRKMTAQRCPSQLHRVEGTFPHACLLRPQRPRKGSRHCVLLSSSEEIRIQGQRQHPELTRVFWCEFPGVAKSVGEARPRLGRCAVQGVQEKVPSIDAPRQRSLCRPHPQKTTSPTSSVHPFFKRCSFLRSNSLLWVQSTCPSPTGRHGWGNSVTVWSVENTSECSNISADGNEHASSAEASIVFTAKECS